MFSFSGGTILKLQNQLSDDTARSAVMVGLWSHVDGLLAEQQFERMIKEGWTRNRKWKASVSLETLEQSSSRTDTSLSL